MKRSFLFKFLWIVLAAIGLFGLTRLYFGLTDDFRFSQHYL